MECINELRNSLNVHLGWNKARITCFVNMLLALLTTRTVNLNKLACVVSGEASFHRDIEECSDFLQNSRLITNKFLDLFSNYSWLLVANGISLWTEQIGVGAIRI